MKAIINKVEYEIEESILKEIKSNRSFILEKISNVEGERILNFENWNIHISNIFEDSFSLLLNKELENELFFLSFLEKNKAELNYNYFLELGFKPIDIVIPEGFKVQKGINFYIYIFK